MKRNFFRVGIGIVVVLLLWAGQALAQDSDIFGYTVPFAFRAGDVKMPAGQYIVKIPTSAKGLICIESMSGNVHAMLLTIPFAQGRNQAPNKVVFHQYGREYFLSEVWNSASAKGQELMKSKAEQEFVQQARIHDTVDIALTKR